MERLFFNEIKSPEKLFFKGINLSKYFYDQYLLKKKNDSLMFNKANRKITFKRVILSPTTLIFACYKLIRIILKGNYKNRVFFVSSSSRIIFEGNNPIDIYNKNIINHFGKSKFFIIQSVKNEKNVTYNPDICIYDFLLILFVFYGLFRLFFHKEIIHFTKMNSNDLEKLGFTKNEIKKSITIFYVFHYFYTLLLKIFTPKSVLIICHYGFPQLISACKFYNIPTIELMHGLILKNHSHYWIEDFNEVFRNSFKNYLLPDYILVYGNYWKNILISGKQFLSDQISIIGYYLYIPNNDKIINKKTKKIKILITSQPQVQKDLFNYVKFLNKNLNHNKWEIIIKPHPNENPLIYNQVIQNNFISISFNNIHHLLQEVDIHISVFSTVLFEALLYNVSNYSLLVKDYKSYCNEIIESGVASKLEPTQIPIIFKKKNKMNTKYFFEDFNGKSLELFL